MTEPVNGFGASDGPPPFDGGDGYGAPGPAGRVPPHDTAAEKGVLGGILSQGEDVLAGMATVLSPSDFYDKRHALVYEAALAIYNQGAPVDAITVTSRLNDLDMLAKVGGPAFITRLSDAIISPRQADHYAQLVHDKSLLRGFIDAARQAMDAAYTHRADPEEALEEAESAIFTATHRRHTKEMAPMSTVAKAALDMVAKRYKNKGMLSGVTTGFKRLDRLTTGLQPGDLIIIAGRPSMGKTAFALNVAANTALQANTACAVFSLEMSKEQLGLRLLAGEARVSGSSIRSGFLSPEDFGRLTDAADKLAQAPIYIDDTPALSVLELRAKARRLKADNKLDLIVVDYLQLMRGRRESQESREREISDISRSLKALAKELDVPVIALSQLNRKVEDRPGDKRPQLADLRESGAIEQDADVIAFIYRKKVYKKKEDPEEADDHVAEIIIGKQRNGPTGIVKLAFLDDLTRFENLSFEEEDSLPE